MNFLIVTTSYNRPELLQRNIDAILSQPYKQWLHIIVDDCSRDNEIAKVLVCAEKNNKTLVLKNTENLGCNASRNRALDYIQEKGLSGYLLLVDDDDYLLPNALTDAAKCIQQSASSWLTADCIYPNGKKASTMKRYGELSYLNDYMHGDSIRGDLTHFIDVALLQNIRFSSKFKNGQEWYFFCQVAAQTNLYALNQNSKVIEYLSGGLSEQKVNQQQRLAVAQEKVCLLSSIISPEKLSGQQILLLRELLKVNQLDQAGQLLKSIFRYQWHSLRFYRYLIKFMLLKARTG